MTTPAPLEYKNSQEAAEALMVTMKMDKGVSALVDKTLTIELQRNPQLLPYREVMLKFMEKHLGWSALSAGMVKIYVDAYTHQELEDLIRFYQTPTGQKSIETMPELFQRGVELGEKNVEENADELTKSILEEKSRIESQR